MSAQVKPGANPLELRLPELRPDLEFHPGPTEEDGSPTVNVHDPITGTYRKLGWAEAKVLLAKPAPRTLGAALERLWRQTTLRPQPLEVALLYSQAEAEGLTRSSPAGKAAALHATWRRRQVGALQWLLAHYLYIRIPLFNPDRFLAAALPYARLLVSPAALALLAAAFALGAWNLCSGFERYASTFPYFFNAEGVALYALALVGVKTVHEFAHAFTAKGLGVRVPAMGIAFMVLCPLAFCDVTDAWRLRSRRERLSISLAGVAAELALAGLALFVWGLAPEGRLASVCFVLSSVTLLSTLLVNLNPAMRFDGYYVFCDLWGMDNLRERAFAVARWAYRKYLLGVDAPSPEPNLEGWRQARVIIYAGYAVAYRVGLFLGIAALVYYKFTKLLGAFLAAFEIYYFLFLPAVREAADVIKRRKELRFNLRLGLTLAALGLAGAWLALPLPRAQTVAAVVAADEASGQVVYIPDSGRVTAARDCRGEPEVAAGEALFTVESPELEADIAHLEIACDLIRHQIRQSLAGGDALPRLKEKREALAQTEARLEGLRRKREQNTVRARAEGRVYVWDASIRPGVYVTAGKPVGCIADLSRSRIAAYVPEEYASSLAAGDLVKYIPASGEGALRARVRSVGSVNETALRHEQLASLCGGDLPVTRDRDGGLRLAGAFYLVEIEPEGGSENLRIGSTGRVCIVTAPRSLLAEAVRRAGRVLLRESGF